MGSVGMFAVVVMAGVAAAQAPAPAAKAGPSVPATARGQAPAPQPPTAATVLDSASEVPDSEKLERSSRALVAMRDALRLVLEKVEEARRTKDIVKLSCANEKLAQIKGLLRISEQADVSLQEALARQESSVKDNEFTKVMLAQQKVGQLRAEAEECIGQLAFRTDENLFVEVEEPDNLPGGDPTRPPPPEDVVVRPPPASPLR